MPQVPLPHVLSTDTDLLNGKLRIVAPELRKDDSIIEYLHLQENKKTGVLEKRFAIYYFDTIAEKRLAKGDWSNWEIHPTYFEGNGRVVYKFESELNEAI